MKIPSPWLQLILFTATCCTTVLAQGGAFAATLMFILVCHEGGHFLVARRHSLPVSLPYFIPLPPQWTFGTLGAVIGMREPITSRNELIDVAAAGPLAGLVAAIPLLLWGLSMSPVGTTIDPESVIEGNSLAYIGLKYLVFGQLLPAEGGVDVQLHSVAFAAWVGLIITMINLLPIAQLDGGHLAAAILGEKNERWSKRFHLALLAVGGIVFVVLVVDALTADRSVQDALAYAFPSAMPWLVWAGVLAVLRNVGGGSYHPPVNDEPLTLRERATVVIVALVLLAIFTPVPLRAVL